jgi:hypothetical protein
MSAAKKPSKRQIKGPPQALVNRSQAKIYNPSIVEEVIKKVNDKARVFDHRNPPAVLRKLVSDYQGAPVSGQSVNGWRQRGIIPAHLIMVVSHVSGVSKERLLHYHSHPYPDKAFDADFPT